MRQEIQQVEFQVFSLLLVGLMSGCYGRVKKKTGANLYCLI